MKLTIDTDTKTISLEETNNIPLLELFNTIEKLLPNTWKEYSLTYTPKIKIPGYLLEKAKTRVQDLNPPYRHPFNYEEKDINKPMLVSERTLFNNGDIEFKEKNTPQYFIGIDPYRTDQKNSTCSLFIYKKQDNTCEAINKNDSFNTQQIK